MYERTSWDVLDTVLVKIPDSILVLPLMCSSVVSNHFISGFGRKEISQTNPASNSKLMISLLSVTTSLPTRICLVCSNLVCLSWGADSSQKHSLRNNWLSWVRETFYFFRVILTKCDFGLVLHLDLRIQHQAPFWGRWQVHGKHEGIVSHRQRKATWRSPVEKYRDSVRLEECYRPAAGSAGSFHGQPGCWSEDGVSRPHTHSCHVISCHA